MIEELKVIIKAEIDKFKAGLDDAEKQTKSFKEQVEEAGKSVEEDLAGAGEKISGGLKIGMAAIAATGAALLALGASTQEYRNEQAKLTTAFETAGASAEVAKETYNGLYRVIGDSGVATEAAAHLAKLTTNQQDLSEWTNICQGVYATFGDSLPIESLTEAANETAKTGALTGGLADALNWAGVNEEAFQEKLDACNTEAQREQLIRETLNGLYNEAAANYEKNNAAVIKQNEAQAKMNEATAELGAALAPVMAELTRLGAEVLTAITPYIKEFADKYLPTIISVLEGVVNVLADALEFMSEHKVLMGTIATAIGVIVTAIGLYNAVQAIKTAMNAAEVTSVWGLVAAYVAKAAAMMAAIAPYVLIVAAIAAVIAIVVLLIKYWDDIVAACKKAFSAMADKAKELGEKISTKFNEMKTNVSNKVNEMKDAAVNKFNELKQGCSNKISELKNSIANIIPNIKSSIVNGFSSAKDSALNVFEKLRSGITGVFDKVTSGIKSAIDKIKSFFKFDWELPKIKLPHFSIEGKFSLNPPSIPKLKVDWYAQGGVFDNPTLFGYGGRVGGLGEAGAEAIVPLENNLGWLDKLAEMLNQRMGGSAPIVLQVDGKTLAEVSVDNINKLTRQTGSLPLVIR